ncbi:MAG: sulfur carrier protein ThiS [Hyphomicrobiaceae bacterium]
MSQADGGDGGDGAVAPTVATALRLTVNGADVTVSACVLDALLIELGYGDARVATAVDGVFIPASARAGAKLHDGQQIEIVAPRQGG